MLRRQVMFLIFITILGIAFWVIATFFAVAVELVSVVLLWSLYALPLMSFFMLGNVCLSLQCKFCS
jgi:hypothetical protein